MSTQIIENNGVPEYAVVPIADYRVLIEKAEMLDDVAAFDKAEATLTAGEDELVPSDIVDLLLANVNAVKVPPDFYTATDGWHFTLGDGRLDI